MGGIFRDLPEDHSGGRLQAAGGSGTKSPGQATFSGRFSVRKPSTKFHGDMVIDLERNRTKGGSTWITEGRSEPVRDVGPERSAASKAVTLEGQ